MDAVVGGLDTDPLTTPLEFNAKEGLEDGEETAESGAVPEENENDPRIAPGAVAAMRYLIFFPGAPLRGSFPDPEGGALVDYPFKIEVWEEEQKKRPKSAMKTGKH